MIRFLIAISLITLISSSSRENLKHAVKNFMKYQKDLVNEVRMFYTADKDRLQHLSKFVLSIIHVSLFSHTELNRHTVNCNVTQIQ